MKKTRIYKYALNPTPSQKEQLEKCGKVSRFLWNSLVHQTNFALREMDNGRRSNIENEYKTLIKSKDLIGQRVTFVNAIAKEKQISKKDALNIFVEEKAKEDIVIFKRKKAKKGLPIGSRAIRKSNRKLAGKYAMEKINSKRNALISGNQKSVWTGIQAKWIDFLSNWDSGVCKSPRKKKRYQISAIQKQIHNGKCDIAKYVDLSWCGSACLEKVEVIKHREFPINSKINQIALTKDSQSRWYICCFIEADESVFQRKFTKTGKTVGIDPGLKTALTTSDGKKITPVGLYSHNAQERRLKKLSRKLDRQTRINNPDCFNENGTWKRGKRIYNRTKGMLETIIKMTSIRKYFVDAKTNYYHNTAIQLLNQYDIIGVGDAKIHTFIKGEGKIKRVNNLKIREHAISGFKNILKDKAKLSLTPKHIYDNISEKYTTVTCSNCNKLTGPSGEKDLNIRNWTCSECGSNHDRDVNAAINIKNKTLTTVAQTVSDGKPSKVRSATKLSRKRQNARAMETKNSQDFGPMSIPFTSAQVSNQTIEDARIPEKSVTEHFTKVLLSVETTAPLKKVECS